MWTYSQSTGRLTGPQNDFPGLYAGHGEGVNNPAMQEVHKAGPLPRGFYTIGAPQFGGRTGPYSLPLIPDAANEMFGRSAFFIHGDNPKRDNSASEGCIIAPRPIREIVNAGGNRLEVVA